jgi:hypothetical protein
MREKTISSNRGWVQEEFGGVCLGDKRRNDQLLDAATAMADHPSASNPQRFDWNQLRGFYRMVDTQRVQPEILQSTHRERTRTRMLACPNRVLVVHDTTEVDFTDHPALHDELGPIGTGGGVGLLQHNSLAFDPQARRLLGLIDQHMELRRPKPINETRKQRALRPHKESELWLKGFRGVGRAPSESRWIDVCDRGGDYFEAMQESRRLGHEFLIRVCHDRRVSQSSTDEETGDVVEQWQTLHGTMRAISAATTKVVSVASRGGRPKREAATQVGYTAVRLQPPQHAVHRHGMVSMPVTLIRVWEAGADEARAEAQRAKADAKAAEKRVRAAVDAVAEVKKTAALAEPLKAAMAEEAEARVRWAEAKAIAKERTDRAKEYLDWWLATNSPIKSIEDALEAVSDYEWRWPIAEEYHKVEKTGLRIEAQRFETAQRMLAALAIMAVVAIRILQLRYARDEQPNADASQIATAEEIEMVAFATKFRGGTMTIKRFVDGIARLGGYLGRKCDGPPGWRSLWLGYQRLNDMILGHQLSISQAESDSQRPRLPNSG